MRFSVVIPTFERRNLVVRNVWALERQVFRDFEVVVSVDGSTDGSAAALRELSLTFPLIVVEHPNRGRAHACNAGVAAAGGDLVLLLDDDMEAHPLLLAEHDRAQREGADLVIGDVPLHSDSPRNLLSSGVGLWAEQRRERLSAPGAELRLDDLLTGQCSISRRLFQELGGFDVRFTRDGLFGGEDIDFGYRLRSGGYRVVFNPRAISHQYYDVDPSAYLRRSFEAGRSEQELIVKHPKQAAHLWRGPRFRSRLSRLLLGPLVIAPSAATAPIRATVAAGARTGWNSPWLRNLFFDVRTMEHRRGARAARRALSTGRVVVLAYHAVADLADDRVLAEYGIPPESFARQLDRLRRRGHVFVDLDEVLGALRGEQRLPPRAVLVTFDDCYADLVDAARLLAERRIPGVAFAVGDHIGGTNEWDHGIGAGVVPLLDADGLRSLGARGIEIGSHSATHMLLSRVPRHELERELAGSAETIAALRLPAPRAFAYPHGDWTPEVAEAVADAGYEVAFTVDAGVVERGASMYALPRLEVLAGDGPVRLGAKLAVLDWPEPLRRRVFKLLAAPKRWKR